MTSHRTHPARKRAIADSGGEVPVSDGEILLSLVMACYNVAPYLDDFFRSLRRQGGSRSAVEVILVDDGSTDSTLADLKAWSERLPFRVTVLEKSNGGASSARNLGLEHARGTWVSFPDPDDVLAPDYLRTIRRFLRSKAATSVDLVATNILYLDDASGELRDHHPLRRRFSGPRRIVSLVEQPDIIHLSGGTAVLRRERLTENGLKFDLKVRPNFEDAALIAQYLLVVPEPRVALLRDAHYYYRRRTDGSSLTQGSWSSTEKYADVVEFGHLETLRAAKELRGAAPAWLQNVILYDLFWYFRADARIHSPTAAIPADVIDRFFELVGKVLEHIDPDIIRSHRSTPVQLQVREAVLRLRDPQQPLERVHVWQIDREQALASVKYYWAGEEPDVQIFLDGTPTKPVFTKSRSVDYFGRALMWERISWFPATGSLTASIDGAAAPVTVGPPRDETYEVALKKKRQPRRRRPVSPPIHSRIGRAPRAPKASKRPASPRQLLGRVRRVIAPRRRLALASDWFEQRREKAFDTWVLRAARSSWAKRRFGGSWILVDRDIQAHDNAEHLYRYIRDEAPGINVWFALGKDSPDWPRLKADGFRLLPYRSWRHMVALLHCTELVSSQVDNYVMRPYAGRPYPAPRWRFTFLQHGVTKDDLSRWVNPKRPSLVLSVTHDEHASFVGDDTPYVWTEREVALTGFPRHDALQAKALEVTDAERNLIVLMPTWRRHLLGDQIDRGNLRELLPGFWESQFIRSWLGLAGSDELRAAAEARGYQIAFFPHPNLQEYITADRLPAGVQVMRYADVDIQEVLARARVVVSDFSSLAFDAAFIGRPVVYFQFDADTFFDGSHPYRRGYFDYATQGFGPVCETVEEASSAVADIVKREGALDPVYAARIESTFAHRDGRASERTVAAIKARRRPFHQW